MAIVSFRFADKKSKWSLRDTRFGAFNLLVGHSGVGKTRILHAIQRVFRSGVLRMERGFCGAWSIEMEIAARRYQWNADIQEGAILSESIRVDGKLLVDRDSSCDAFVFNDQSLPRIKNTSSVITVYDTHPLIAPLNAAMVKLVPYDLEDDFGAFGDSHAEIDPQDFEVMDLPLPATKRLWRIQENDKVRFQDIKERFIEIFPTVEDLQVREFAIDGHNGNHTGLSL
ncbi:MAG: hypothetical protein HQL99_01690, partial [Magnetococcales bacterium]|nr:hypothetical protein [Magnetococcales bacterium]